MVTRIAVHAGESVTQGEPLLWLATGQPIAASTSGVVVEVLPAGSYIGVAPIGTPSLAAHVSSTAAVIQRATPLTVEAEIPAAMQAEWKIGTSLRMTQQWAGHIVKRVDQANGTWVVTGVFPSAHTLPIGSHVVLTARVKVLHDTLEVPAGAIISRRGGYAVRAKTGLIPVRVIDATANAVAVRGRLAPRQAVWVPAALGEAGLRPRQP